MTAALIAEGLHTFYGTPIFESDPSMSPSKAKS
jgi:hypothetical protein